MAPKRKSPAAPARANWASEVFIAANSSKLTKNALSFQQNWLARRFGLTPTRAAYVAELAFGTEARA